MRILGIETSCDETAVALVVGEGDALRVERSLVASQADLHAKYGGVVPEVAARSHVEAMVPLLLELGVPRDGKGIDAVAATAGPGLLPALRIGLEYGKALAWAWGKPFVPVNHLEGHVYSVWLEMQEEGTGNSDGLLRNSLGRNLAQAVLAAPSELPVPPGFPAVCLLVSGGHTEIVLMKDYGSYELLGATRDDAAGEAFDKVAKLLGLGYPGGPAISREAAKGNPEAIPFPRPMLESGDLDFSFSGLKTAVAVHLKAHPDASVPDVAASFQEAAVDTLATKLLRAVAAVNPASVIVTGGVSANARLREDVRARLAAAAPGKTLHLPALDYTGDNAAMIAAAGYFRARAKDFANPPDVKPDPNLRLA